MHNNDATTNNDNNEAHRWNRNPRPRPQTLSTFASLINFGWSYIFLNWLSGALGGVVGSDFIGYVLLSSFLLLLLLNLLLLLLSLSLLLLL